MTLRDTIEHGEYVMIALAALFVVILTIWIVRGVALRRVRKGCRRLMQRVRDCVTEGDIDNARQICEVRNGAIARVVGTGLRYMGQPIADVKGAMREAAQIEKKKISRGARWLRIISVISPLLGLTGTLIGLIDILRDFGDSALPVETSTLCGAIAPAIVTTVVGLGVGIIALVALACLEGSIDSARRYIDDTSMEFTDLLNEPA